MPAHLISWRQVDPADSSRPALRSASLRGAPTGSARDLHRTVAVTAEPHGCRRHADAEALPGSAAARRLRAHRRSRELAPVLGELARWGYEWAWSPPRASERVDLGAIFRLVPGLVNGQHGVSGYRRPEVTDGPPGRPTTYRVTDGRRQRGDLARRRGRLAPTPRCGHHRRPGSAPWARSATATGSASSGNAALASTCSICSPSARAARRRVTEPSATSSRSRRRIAASGPVGARTARCRRTGARRARRRYLLE